MLVEQQVQRRAGFTLVEIMIVVAIISVLAAIAVPGFMRARKRAQATKVLTDLRMIDAAVDQYALENNRLSGSTIAVAAWTSYLKQGTVLYATGADLFGTSYGPTNSRSNSQDGCHNLGRVFGCRRDQLLFSLRPPLVRDSVCPAPSRHEKRYECLA